MTPHFDNDSFTILQDRKSDADSQANKCAHFLTLLLHHGLFYLLRIDYRVYDCLIQQRIKTYSVLETSKLMADFSLAIRIVSRLFAYYNANPAVLIQAGLCGFLMTRNMPRIISSQYSNVEFVDTIRDARTIA